MNIIITVSEVPGGGEIPQITRFARVQTRIIPHLYVIHIVVTHVHITC